VPATPLVNSPRRGALGWVFLDRDGTLNVKPPAGEYIERADDLALLPGAAEAVRVLNRAGIWTGVVTNQRGVALGRMSAAELDAVHERLAVLLARDGASLDAIYACVHAADECDCRKPRPGMLLRAREEQPGLDFGRAAIVGDSLTDIEAGRSVGVRTILIEASDGGEPSAASRLADDVVPHLLHAARLLLAAPLAPRSEP
jgi:D-glycero-D-manno-heptose 1,7-bisphosphate phosphatase